MVLASSWLSQVSQIVVDFLGTELQHTDNEITIAVGAPGENVKRQEDEPILNLFFFRVEPWEFEPGVGKNDRWHARVHLMVTALGAKQVDALEETVSAGEVELRILGEVMRAFHEHPILGPQEAGGEEVELQITPHPASLDEINNLWSMQGEVSYRPSALYELSVAVIAPNVQSVPAPLIASVGVGVVPDAEATPEPFAGETRRKEVVAGTVDLGSAGWAPLLCLVEEGRAAYSITVDHVPDAPIALKVLVTGDPEASVDLHLESWDTSEGWQPLGESKSVVPGGAELDPESIDESAVIEVEHPPIATPGQTLIYATREYVREPDGSTITVRSNPVLVTRVEGGV